MTGDAEPQVAPDRVSEAEPVVDLALALPARPAPDAVRRAFEADGHRLLIDRAASEDEDPALALFADAVLLDDHAPLLECVDRWLGAAQDWTPAADARAADAPPASRVWTLASRVGERRRIGVVPAPGHEVPAALESPWDELVSLVPGQVEATLVLAELGLDAADAARLGPGATLLLPGSFARSWEATVDVAGLRLAAGVEPERDAVTLKGRSTSVPADGPGRVRVRTTRPWRLAATAVRGSGELRLGGRLDEPVLVDLDGAERAAHPVRLGEGLGARLDVDGPADGAPDAGTLDGSASDGDAPDGNAPADRNGSAGD